MKEPFLSTLDFSQLVYFKRIKIEIHTAHLMSVL